jgi:hypothetical protein
MEINPVASGMPPTLSQEDESVVPAAIANRVSDKIIANADAARQSVSPITIEAGVGPARGVVELAPRALPFREVTVP